MAIHDLSFNNDGSILASDMGGNSIYLWDVHTRQSIGRGLVGHTSPVLGVSFSKDGKRLVSGGLDKQVVVWDVDFDSWRERVSRIANRPFTDDEKVKFFGPELLPIASGLNARLAGQRR